MIHYIAFYTLNDDVTPETVEEMIRMSRSRLLRINEAHNVRSGHSLEEDSDFPFFVCAEFESLEKLEIFREDPQNLKFEREVIEPHTGDRKEYLFETEPGKDHRYS